MILRHVGIVVSDLEDAEHFYCDLLGFAVVSRQEEIGKHMDAMLGIDGVDVTTVKLDTGAGMIELLQFHAPGFAGYKGPQRELSDCGISHLALTVKDLDREFERLTEAGVKFVGDPVLSGTCRVAFAMDPDGNHIELVQECQ